MPDEDGTQEPEGAYSAPEDHMSNALLFDTWELTVAEARARITALRKPTKGQLEALHAHEVAHLRYDDGRKGILDCIEERLGEAEVVMPAPGQARSPAPSGGGGNGGVPGADGDGVPDLPPPEDVWQPPSVEKVAAPKAPEPGKGDRVYVYDGQGQKHLARVVEVRPPSCPVVVQLNDEHETRVVAAWSADGEPGTYEVASGT